MRQRYLLVVNGHRIQQNNGPLLNIHGTDALLLRNIALHGKEDKHQIYWQGGCSRQMKVNSNSTYTHKYWRIKYNMNLTWDTEETIQQITPEKKDTQFSMKSQLSLVVRGVA